MQLKKQTYYLTLFLFCISVAPSFSHALTGQLENLSRTDIFFVYLKFGFTHIIPLGFDHILFVLSIFFLNPKPRIVIVQATVFTVAHTITLGLAMYGVIKPPSSIVEPIIAISILFVALGNVLTNSVHTTRIVVIFIFGLIHGMGFASALTDLGLPQKDFLLGLISFNVGVELGQIAIILLAYFLVAKWFGNKPYYKKYIVIPVSIIISIVAFYWFIERVFFTS